MQAREPASFWRENVVAFVTLLRVLARMSKLAETSYEMLEVLSFCDQERMQPPSLKITVRTFLVKNGKMKLPGESIF